MSLSGLAIWDPIVLILSLPDLRLAAHSLPTPPTLLLCSALHGQETDPEWNSLGSQVS